jgi:adenine-specific DNA-methyltransferase
MKKQKLELTWIGKDARPRLEPRILLEDPNKSYHAKHRVSEADSFDNRLIFGDNLLALKALEQEFAGKVKCVFIDPPYNTGSAFTHYDDGLEHSIWLGLMRDRLEIIYRLLSDDGSLWITIDDNEAHYLKVLCDEIFGRVCSVANVAWRSSDAANNDAKTFSVDHNHILVYSKNPGWLTIPLPRTGEANAHYKNPDNDPNGPWFMGNLSSPKPRPNLRYTVESPAGLAIEPPANGWRWQKNTMIEMIETGEVVFSADGKRVIKKTYLKDQGGLSASTMWDDIEDTGHNRQAKYELKKLFPDSATSDLFATPKPERLIKKVLMIATRPNDIVLDSFAGSGTTGAVAHKMGRRWIMVELGDHCHTHIIPRLKKVIDGEDKGGITEATGWKSGGGFRYFSLAPSLLEKDRWGNWVVNKEYNAEMLAAAICKLEGFTYAPSDTHYWQHGHSTETDFIYVTTQTLNADQLQALSDDVGEQRSLLVCCSAHHGGGGAANRYPNLTLKKIPKMVLTKCEWGHDDYSLNVANLPMAAPSPVEASPSTGAGRTVKGAKSVDTEQGGLFGGEGGV